MFKKIISIILVITILLNYVPIYVYAEELVPITPEKYIEEEAYIVSEITEKREVNKKYFEMSDGSTLLALYNENIHYDDNGTLKEIDNSLTLEDSEYSNKKNDYKIKFSKKSTNKKLVTISKSNNKISWYLKNQEKVNMQNINLEDITDIEDNLLVNNLHSSIIYKDILNDIDIRYDNNGSSIKESIILKSKDSLSNELIFIYDLGKLEFKEGNEDINIVNSETGEIIYVIEPLYMYDANGIYSSSIDVEITNNGKEYEVKIIPDQEWLTSEERVYPIVIDPTITTSQNYWEIDDTFVYEGDSSNPASSRVNAEILRIGSSSFSSMNQKAGRALIKFNLPELLPGDQIIRANLYLASYPTHQMGYSYPTSSIEFDVHKMTSNWDGNSAYYSNTDNYDSKITDYVVYSYDTSNPIKSYTFNITSIVRDWYITGNNYGVMIKEKNETYGGTRPDAYFFSSDCAATYASARPIISMIYRNQTGLEGYQTYQTSSIGNNEINTNNFNGNLVLTHNDLSTTGIRLPASIYHVYNTNDKDVNIGYGNGFRLNYSQEVSLVTIGDIEYAKYIDEDGTAHYFTNESGVYKDEDGLDLTLTLEDNIFIMKDKSGNISEFTNNNGVYKLTKIIDTNNNNITVNYQNDYISSIIDGTGKTLTFSYIDNLLAKITNNVNEEINYSYTSSNLTQITYMDNKTNVYDYQDNLLVSVTGIDNSKLVYEYYPGIADRVKSIKEYSSDNILGNTLNINYLEYATQIIDNKGLSNIYTYDTLGRTISITSSDGTSERYGRAYTYASGTGKKNKLASVNNFIKPVDNKVYNSSFEKETNWTLSQLGTTNGICSYSSEQSKIGSKSLKCTSTNLTDYPVYTQNIILDKGKTYTLSFDLKTSITEVEEGVTVEIKYSKNDNTVYSKKEVYTTSSDWERKNFTFEFTEEASLDYVIISLGTNSMKGFSYFDNIQIEEGTTVNPYNLIENSSFNDGLTSWRKGTSTDSNDTVVTLNNDNVLKFTGIYNKAKLIYQPVKVSGEEGDTYIITGYVKSNGIPYYNSNKSEIKMPLGITHSDGSFTWEGIYFSSLTTEWQYFYKELVMPSDYTQLDVYTSFYYNNNEVYFDDINLFKDVTGNAYTYDSNGNVISTSNLAKQNSTFKYDSNNQLISNVTTYGSKYDYEYDKYYKNRILKGSSYDLTYTLDYDTYGNNTNIIITKKKNIDEIEEGEYYIRRQTQELYLGVSGTNVEQNTNKDIWILEKTSSGKYEFKHKSTGKYMDVYSAGTANGTNIHLYASNHSNAQIFNVVAVGDGSFNIKATTISTSCINVENGDTTSGTNVELYSCSDTDSQRFYFEKVDTNAKYIETKAEYTEIGDFQTKLIDQKGNETSYNYNDKGLVSSITNSNNVSTNYTYDINHNLLSVNTGNYVNSYTYDYNRLKTITYNNLIYSFDYDTFGNNTSILINNNNLITNTYESNNGNLSKRTYANTDEISYTYDNFNRLKTITNETGTINYTYDKMNNLAVIKDSYNNLNTYYKYDLSKRLLEISRNNNFKVNYAYDDKSNINLIEYTLDTLKYINNYTYDNDNKITKVTNTLGIDLNYTYDELSRLNNILYENSNSSYLIDYTYEDIDTLKTTTSLKKITTDNNTYEYTYDTLGNIVEVKIDNNLTNKYYYDDINQLIREDDLINNQTVLYTYDLGGNLLNKKYYIYNSDTLIKEDTYSYSTSRMDQLTSYNNINITYDALGNPITIGNQNLTWTNGRWLQSIEEGSNIYSYKYNEDGIRTSKTINGITTNYSLLEKNIVFEETNNSVIYYIYDASGNVIGLKYNNNTYYYEKNIQNDVIGIMDDSFNLLAIYEYDSWGKILSIKDSNGNEITDLSNIALMNPIRYRSYYYDDEINMYYLNSRYYNPEWGRFVNGDVYLSTGQGILSLNIYAYTENNPISRIDADGEFWESAFDVISLGASVVEICINPTDIMAWAGLVGDSVDLIPFITGVGEVTKTIKITTKTVNKPDEILSAAKKIYNKSVKNSDIRISTGSYEILYKNGYSYIGKGGFKRAMVSAKKHSTFTDDIISIRWKSSKSSRDAFIDEYLMQKRLYKSNSFKTYNKIWSPGRRFYGD